MNRRQFLKNAAATLLIPAYIKAESLMKVVAPKEIFVPQEKFVISFEELMAARKLVTEQKIQAPRHLFVTQRQFDVLSEQNAIVSDDVCKVVVQNQLPNWTG